MMDEVDDFYSDHPGVGPLRESCPDCRVGVGERHHPHCDVARCLKTGRQRFGCDGDHGGTGYSIESASWNLLGAIRPDLPIEEVSEKLDVDDAVNDLWQALEDASCGYDVWSGFWPGDLDAARLGWWCVGPPWTSCEPDVEGATPDLNRLVIEGRWNRKTQRWEART